MSNNPGAKVDKPMVPGYEVTPSPGPAQASGLRVELAPFSVPLVLVVYRMIFFLSCPLTMLPRLVKLTLDALRGPSSLATGLWQGC